MRKFKEQLKKWREYWSGYSCPILVLMGFYFAAAVFLLYVFFPRVEEKTVTGFTWERNISIEEYKTVQESDWSVPPGGRVYKEETEFKEYVDVLDHYETKTERKSRSVFSHYMYVNSIPVPVYRTEYYTVSYQEPVYRQEPVYATRYYYEIEKWVDSGKDYSSRGNDQEPYWRTDYTLAPNERDIDRSEAYTVVYDNGMSDSKTYDEWLSIHIGDRYKRVYCLSFTYKTSIIKGEEQ